MAKKEIRTILAPLTDGYVMLPTGTVAEILNFTSPKPLRNTPRWLLGELAWHGWQVPIISYEGLMRTKVYKASAKRTHIMIIKTLGESSLVNYIGLATQGLPKLKMVSTNTLVENTTDKLPDTVFSRVSIEDFHAVIPNLDKLTRTVEKAAYNT